MSKPLTFGDILPELTAWLFRKAAEKPHDTRRAARESITQDLPRLRRKVLAEIQRAPGTSDEIANRLGLKWYQVRPRCTELLQSGKIIDAGERRKNESGRWARVWRFAR